MPGGNGDGLYIKTSPKSPPGGDFTTQRMWTIDEKYVTRNAMRVF